MQSPTNSISFIVVMLIATVIVVNTTTYTVNHEVSPIAPPPTSTSSATFAIFSISPIAATNRQTIKVTGVGFGTNPSLVNDSIASDGSVDTLQGSVQPSILINDRTENWGAGLALTSADYDHIGIFLVSWSDTQIVIGGFSSLLGNATNPSQYVIKTGDLVTVTVYGPNQVGIASLDTTVA